MPTFPSSGRRLWHLFLFATLLALGCGSSGPPPGQKAVHPVHGQLFVKGKPAGGAFVLFIPKQESLDSPDPRPRATVNDDGSFTLSTYGDGDGAPAGDYVVTVTWPVDGRDDEDRLQGRYQDRDTTPLKATVKEGKNELPAFKLK